MGGANQETIFLIGDFPMTVHVPAITGFGLA